MILRWVLFALVTAGGAAYLAAVFGIAGPAALRRAAARRLREMERRRWLVWSAGSAAMVAFWMVLTAPAPIPHRSQVLGFLLVAALIGLTATLLRPRRSP